MAVRQIQSRISLKLAFASLIAILVAALIGLEFTRRISEADRAREDDLFDMLALLAAATPEGQQRLGELQASLAAWPGHPKWLALSGSKRDLREGKGMPLPGGEWAESVEIPIEALRVALETEEGRHQSVDSGVSYRFLVLKSDVADNWILVIVRRELSRYWLHEWHRYQSLIFLGCGVFFAFAYYSYREHAKVVFKPLSRLVVEMESRIEKLSGSSFRRDANGDEIQCLTDRYRELISVVDSQRSELEASERLLKRLLEIGNWEATDIELRILAALKDMCEVLGLKTGVFSSIEGKRYKIEQVYDTTGAFREGEVFPLDDVYCSIVVMTGRSIATTHVGGTDWSNLSCYKNTPLESYIAAPIRLEGKIVGTINFSAPEVRRWQFAQFEIDSVRMMARWVEGLMRRERMLRQLNRQAEELRLILDTTPNAIWLTNDKNVILRVNRAAAASVGLSVEEIEGKEVSELFSEEADHPFREDQAVLESGEALLGSIRPVTTAEGSQRWSRSDKLPYWLPNEQCGVITVETDITELVEVQKAFETAEQEFRTAVEAAPVGLVILGKDCRVQLMNTEAERIFGYRREDMVGSSFEPFLGETPLEALKAMLDLEKGRRVEQQFGSEGDLFAKRPDERVVPIEIVFKTLDLSSGPGVMAAVSDISSRLASQQALKDSQERFQLAARGASVGIWDWYDIEGQKTWWSRKYYELLGYQPNEIESSLAAFEQLLHPDDKEATLEKAHACLKSGGAFSTEYRLLCKDGAYRWFAGSGMVLLDADGSVQRMTGSIHDIDARKRAEKELSEAVVELRSANAELSNFAYLSSHDLQEPLRTISSFISLLKDKYGPQLDAEANEYLDFTVTGANRLQNMIRSLLRYSRLSTKLKSTAEFGLRDAIDMAIVDLKTRIEESGAEIVVGADLPKVNGDLNQVSLVLQNLLGNAIKFNRSSSPKVEVASHLSSASELGVEDAVPGEYAVLEVKDNGIGIREKYQKRIFSIFQKLHPSGEYEGSGIGLSMVQKIMQSHGGYVWLKSEEGKGSRFYLAFPIRD